jgi:hypothetical protein
LARNNRLSLMIGVPLADPAPRRASRRCAIDETVWM